MIKPMFISFEGVEGAGKSTQITLLSEYFNTNGIKHIVTREPGGLKSAELIRNIILHHDIEGITELLLFESSRHEHVKKIIMPALSNGKTVICDRFFDSTTAYQAFGRKINIDTINYLNNLASDGLTPDLTILLDLDVKNIEERLSIRNKAKDRLESENLDFFIKVRNGYLEIAKTLDRFFVVDASLGINEIHKKIVSKLRGL